MSSKYEQTTVFEAVCEDPYQTARDAAAAGRQVAGFMCTYTPEELFHAAGYFPVRILGRNSGATHRADAHLPAYTCGFLRSALDMALSGELDFLKLMVFSHTCDSMQNFSDIWHNCVPNVRQLTLTTPVLVGTESAVTYFRDEIARARRILEEGGTPVSDAAIEASVALYDEHRALMRRLYALQRTRPGALTGREMLATVLAASLMPRETHLPPLRALVDAIEAAPAPEADARSRVLVVGNMMQNLDYASAIEGAGCLMIDEDLCSGARAFAMEAAAGGGDPLERLARMYLVPTACPTKHQPGYDTGAALLDKAQGADAKGVIILVTKFCDPWMFDYPYLKKTFEDAGLPTLLVEVESNQPPPEQFRGRLGAFVEMLG